MTLVTSLQKLFIDFVWQGRHWIRCDLLYLHKSDGGLGLVHILSRLHAFRLRFIQDYLYYDNNSCFMIANVFFRKVNNFGYTNQLFSIKPDVYSYDCIPQYYKCIGLLGFDFI